MPRVCIIIPTLNEAEAIGKLIDEIPREAMQQKGYEVEVLVTDGASTDRTGKIAEARGAKVIVEPKQGKGRQMRKALQMVDADFIFMLDGDYTYPPSYITEMLELLRHTYPVVIGSRLRGKIEKGGMSLLNMIGNHLLTLMANLLYKTRISDLCTGYWGMRREVIPNLSLTSNGFDFEAELLGQIAKKGYQIGEVPIYYRRRQTPPKLRSIRDGLRIGWSLIIRRF
ncbi:MAG: glycosyltransferase [Dehalococcoidia bacterium]|nr:MAG: glycosyltransferase [Dehalococcoidia bacterium]